eukprot:sb/3477839/
MSSFHYVPPELLLPITNGHHHRWTTFHTDNSYRQMDVYMASLLLWQITRRTLEGELPWLLFGRPCLFDRCVRKVILEGGILVGVLSVSGLRSCLVIDTVQCSVHL